MANVERISAAQLRRLWNEGLASGPAEPLDMAAIKREARARFRDPPARSR